MSLNALWMSYKTLILAIAPFPFILVSVFCEFAIVPGVYILLSSREEEVHFVHSSSSWHRQMYTLAAHSSKRFKSFLSSYYYGKIIVELGKHKQGIQLRLQCLKSYNAISQSAYK